MSADITVKVTFTRDELCANGNARESNEVVSGLRILNKLRSLGVPAIGTLGLLAVEWGTLTVKHDDGLDGDEWTWTYVGRAMPPEWVARVANPGKSLKLDRPLAKQIADAEEL